MPIKVNMEIRTNYHTLNKTTDKGFILVIFVTWLLAGTMDALAATFILAGGNGAGVFKFVASSLYGKAAFSGGSDMVLQGLIIHYLIALVFTRFYFYLYPRLAFLKRSVVINCILYGLFVWSVMNLIAVPLTRIGWRGIHAQPAIVNAVILIFCIALPITLMASKYYNTKPISSKNL
ncbi:hypothetical protein [Mucilaginibacter agri]|uniref:DUF1440 domain-containing protein n=1 Tax=Mucilaginibacter agri TaxID=2695265 RepID=A0A965ZMG0_9SPHI|nr:hypothetical protein [Mucilaginibacter agri]NCD72291.1 hypothetical protein [Mucilaginibacter agri]